MQYFLLATWQIYEEGSGGGDRPVMFDGLPEVSCPEEETETLHILITQGFDTEWPYVHLY